MAEGGDVASSSHQKYVGAFVVTMGVSVPLNDELAAAGPPDQIIDLAAVRDDYEDPWELWNLVRTVMSTGALAALAVALTRPASRPSTHPTSLL